MFFLLFSCERLPKPRFSYSPERNVESGDTIRFINESSRASSYEWEFGDGGTSSKDHPTYVYQEAGIWEIKLTAYNESGKDYITEPITIYEPTILGFIVYDSTGSNLLEGTTIWVYDNETDRDNLLAPIFAGITDNKGVVEFMNVEPIIYHIWASREETDGSWTYRGYTDRLVRNELNFFTFSCNWSSDVAAMSTTWQRSDGPRR
jgi:PKD repeat protein